MNKLSNRFSDKLSKLSHAEKYIFYYIENNIEKAKKESLVEMSYSNNVSTTTIIRMCHKLGLSGFSELKYILKNLPQNKLLNSENSIDNIKNNILNTYSNLNRKNLNKLIDLMLHSEKIIIVAVGLSKTIGEYFSKVLMQLNTSTLYIYESHIIDLIPKFIHNNDLVIFISNSGETKTLLDISEKLKYTPSTTVAIVNTPNSSISNYVNLTLSTCANKCTYQGYDITPRSSLLFLIDIILTTFLDKNKNK